MASPEMYREHDANLFLNKKSLQKWARLAKPKIADATEKPGTKQPDAFTNQDA